MNSNSPDKLLPIDFVDSHKKGELAVKSKPSFSLADYKPALSTISPSGNSFPASGSSVIAIVSHSSVFFAS